MEAKKLDIQLLKFYKSLEMVKGSKDRPYIKIKLQDKLESIKCLVEELEHIELLKSKENKLVNLIHILKEQIIQIEENIEGLDDRFSLFVVGMGKHGKSTLLNSLLGSSVVDMDTEPKTWKIDVFYGSTDNLVQIYYSNGETEELTLDKAKNMLEIEEKKREESLDKIEDEFYLKVRELKSIEEKKEYKQLLTDEYLYISPVVEVRWPLPKNNILKDFNLVDTPGLKQNLPGNVKKTLEDYYHKADGVLWLLDATKISASSSKQLIDDLNESIEAIGGETDNIVAVLNYIDKIRSQKGEEGIKRIVEEANRIYGDVFKEIVPISAKEALQAREEDNDGILQNSGYNNLMEVINKRFVYKGNDIKIKSKFQGIKSLSNIMIKHLLEYREILVSENEKRLRLKEDFLKDINNRESVARDKINKMLNNYNQTVEKNISLYMEDLFVEGANKEQIIKEKIFLLDKLIEDNKNSMNNIFLDLEKCNDYHAKVSRFKKYQYIEDYIKKSDLELKYKIKLPSIKGMDFSTRIENDFFTFLNKFELTGTIIKMFKSYSFKKKLNSNLTEMVDRVKSRDLKKIDDYSVKIRENIENIRETSFGVFYCNSTTVKKQLNIIDALIDVLEREISKNNIYEYITGEIKK